MKSGALEYIARGWLWQILGAIRAVATVSEAGEITQDFPSATFHEI